mgnify:CR=1 FL=1
MTLKLQQKRVKANLGKFPMNEHDQPTTSLEKKYGSCETNVEERWKNQEDRETTVDVTRESSLET